jgi:hypothetical protein
MFKVEFKDAEIPIVTFLNHIFGRITHFLKHIFFGFLDLLNPTNWSWIHWVFTGILGVILLFMILIGIIGALRGLVVHRKVVVIFLVILLIFIYLTIIIVYYANNVRIKTDYAVLNTILEPMQFIFGLMFMGIIFSIILSPDGIGRVLNPIIYIKDCIITLLVLSFIILGYSQIILFILE